MCLGPTNLDAGVPKRGSILRQWGKHAEPFGCFKGRTGVEVVVSGGGWVGIDLICLLEEELGAVSSREWYRFPSGEDVWARSVKNQRQTVWQRGLQCTHTCWNRWASVNSKPDSRRCRKEIKLTYSPCPPNQIEPRACAGMIIYIFTIRDLKWMFAICCLSTAVHWLDVQNH